MHCCSYESTATKNCALTETSWTSAAFAEVKTGRLVGQLTTDSQRAQMHCNCGDSSQGLRAVL